jgi:hypothetical protein
MFRLEEQAKQKTSIKQAANRSLFATCFMLASSSTLKMDAIYSSEM